VNDALSQQSYRLGSLKGISLAHPIEGEQSQRVYRQPIWPEDERLNLFRSRLDLDSIFDRVDAKE
jgi:hypothetical protein